MAAALQQNRRWYQPDIPFPQPHHSTSITEIKCANSFLMVIAGIQKASFCITSLAFHKQEMVLLSQKVEK